MKYDIEPIGKNVFVKVDEPKAKTSEYGVSIPTNIDPEKQATGVVISIGDEVKKVKPGDHIVFGMYSGEDFTAEEDFKKMDYRFVLEEWILCKLHDKKKK